MPKRLPLRLEREPLVDSVCELQVASAVDLHTILPGIFYSSLRNVGKVEQMPNMAIPDVIRSAQPESMHANSQLMRLHWDDYFITIGTRNVVVGPKLPYQGWEHYRQRIIEVFSLLLAQSFVSGVNRLSIRYTNVVPATDLAAQNSVLDWHLRVGERELVVQNTQLRTEIEGPEYRTIIQVGTGAVIKILPSGDPRNGSLVDIDTLTNCVVGLPAQFSAQLLPQLDAIRHQNKITFFDCLKDETIASMGPTYE